MSILLLAVTVSCQTKTENSKEHISYVDSIRETASRMVDAGNVDRAVAFFDSAYRVIPNPGIGDEIRKYSFMGQTYYPKLEDYHRAIANLDSIFLILNTRHKANAYSREYSTALFQKGDWLFKLHKYSEAYQNYYDGKLMAEKILDPCAISEYAYRLGMVSYKQAKYQEAASYFKQCFEDAGHCTRDFRTFALQQELLANTSLSYSKCGMTDSSIIFGNRALAFIRKNEVDFPDRHDYTEMAKGVIYGNQSALYLVKGDTTLAEDLLKKSFEINRKEGFDNHDAQTTLVKLGELYLKMNQFQKTYATISMLRESLDSIPNQTVEIGFNKISWHYYDKLGLSDQAYQYLQTYLMLKDSLDRDLKKLVIADADKDFHSIEQQYRYNILTKENEVKKVYLYIALLFSGMTVVILFLLWKNWRATTKNIEELTYLNKQVTFQNDQMEQTLAHLKQSILEKDRILKVVAHDLRNPIGAIANISLILLDEIELSSEHQKMMELVKESSWQSIEMINELLTASISTGPSQMKLEWVNVSKLVIQCVDQLRFKATEKKQQIKLSVDVDLKVVGDREKLSRVMSNLILNAIKFSELETVIHVGMGTRDRNVELAVDDEGIGIPASIQDSIFDMFGDSKRPGTLGEQAFGIGLPFSKQIVEAHGGKIWFTSKPDGGTVFYVQLPVGQEIPEQSNAPV